MKKEQKKPYLFSRTNCYDKWNETTIKTAYKLSDTYSNFLDKARTERLAVEEWIKILEKNGFKNMENIKSKLKPWDKVYFNFRDKNLFAAVIWKNDITKTWFRLICSHVDSPRIDLKYMPIYDSDWLCLLKTHYYGWIKKYQWVTIPLSMHWVIYDKNWKKVNISIWDKKEDPIFFLSDLLPHLWRDQLEKKWSKVIEWEDMNLIIGSRYSPANGEKLKENILKLLYEAYWITEKWFLGAELELVPSQMTKSIWFDKSLLWGYGHDDRVCAYIWMQSLIDLKSTPEFTSIVYWTDKEEIWSKGTTSSDSRTFPYFIEKLLKLNNKNIDLLDIDNVFFNSMAISWDVWIIMDPNFKWVFDPQNTALVNNWLIIEKYTWHGWKYSANDADAEYINKIINHFDKNNIIYQMWGHGKIDLWWWGTISQYFAKLWVQIIDMWIWVMNMHAPFEVIAKADMYACYQWYKSFWSLK